MPQKRCFGIDLLRILSMLYIVVLHYCIFGGLSGSAPEGTPLYTLNCAVQLLTVCAVNCFGLISGYVGYTDTPKPQRWSAYLSLWLEVVFYSFVIFAVYGLVCPGEVSRRDYLGSFFPVTSNAYWYFTAYTGLFLLMPVLNAGIRACSKARLLKLCLVISVIFTFSSLWADPFHLNNGYSFIWLVILYLLGAMLKKSNVIHNVSPATAFGGILLVLILRLLWQLHGPTLTVYLFRLHRSSPESYTAPSTLLLSVLHIIAFAGLNISSPSARRFLSFAAPGSFAIYLLNTHPVIWSSFIVGRFSSLHDTNSLTPVFYLICISLLFVFLSLLIDAVRQKLFRLCRVDAFSAWIVRIASRVLNRALRLP